MIENHHVDIMSEGDMLRKSRLLQSVVDNEQVKLIRTGIPVIDEAIGGLSPGEVAVLAAKTGIGKSSIVEYAISQTDAKVGVLSLEDGVDVWSARIASRMTGINSLKIRMNAISAKERRRLAEARAESEGKATFAVAVGAPLETAVYAIERLGEMGCELCVVDYLNKVKMRGTDRTTEVGFILTSMQRALWSTDMAGLFIAQIHRLSEGQARPTIHSMKNSGDIENEARAIVLGWKHDKIPNHTTWQLAKSTSGGEGATMHMTRDNNGVMVRTTAGAEGPAIPEGSPF